MKKIIFRHPETKKIISKANYDLIMALEKEKQDLAKREQELSLQKAQIDKRLKEIEKSGIEVPEVVREVIKGLLLPIIKQFGFNAEELEIIKPTPTDPIVRYAGKIILWYLPVK